jgi:hypothetical protein
MRRLFILFFSLTLASAAFSQSDSLLFAAVAVPKTPKDAGDPLFYGREYVGYGYVIEGIPFYATEDWQKGTIVYRDVTYTDVKLKYDLVKDEVLVLHPNGYTPIVLFSPRIQSFVIGAKRFVYLSADEIAPYSAGIYEEISTGAITLYARRSKLLEEKIVINVLEREVVDNHSYYVKKDGKFIAVDREKDIMNLIGSKRKESKTLLKKEGLKFRKNPEGALRTIVNFYNQSSR